MKKVWLDITNSPHVVFYYPILKKIKEHGYEVVISAREYAQIKGLLKLFNIEHFMIGKHMKKNKFKKLVGFVIRSNKLYKFAKDKNINVAISMGSHDMMMAAKRLNIPHLTLFDYEYSFGHHISFRLSNIILSPKGVSKKILDNFGAKDKVIFYPGLKEQFYIHYYLNGYNEKYGSTAQAINQLLNIDGKRIVVVIRPEATQAHYQTNKNSICFSLVEYLDSHPKNPVIVILPRVESQKRQYVSRRFKNVIIPNEAVNGIELIACCDLVIGAGGTINREAAAIGTPAYTIYQGGKMCAVDNMLIETKRMVHIKSENDFNKIKVEKKSNSPICYDKDLSEMYLEVLESLIKS